MSNTVDEYRGYGTIAPTAEEPSNVIVGTCIPYNVETYISTDAKGREIWEMVKPGAVTEILRQAPKICALIEHTAPQGLLGSNKDGTLDLWDSPQGLRFRITLPKTTYADDLVAAMRANPKAYGASWHMQIAPKDYTLAARASGGYLRTIHRIPYIREITITAFPFYATTQARIWKRAEATTVTATGDGGAAARTMLKYLQIRERAAAIV